ncbi:hypothetical protein ACFL5Y_01210 [Candidatus Omnitrophota bacterium]
MIKKSRIASILVLIFFLFNTVECDTTRSFSIENSSVQTKLAPSSIFDDLVGIQHKDIGRIIVALEANLVKLADDNLLNMRTFETRLNKWEDHEDTIFYPADMQFFFRERILLGNDYLCVKCRVRDNKDGRKYSKGPRTYYAVFPLAKDEKGGVPINIYTEKEYAKFKDKLDDLRTHNQQLPQRQNEKPKDAEAIEKYVRQNEAIIGKFIRERIDAGDFTEIRGRAEELGWDKKYPDRKRPSTYWPEYYLKRIKSRLNPFLNKLGTSVEKAFEGKNMVFIKVPAEKYPLISENGHRITVVSHMSANAVYVLVDSEVFDFLTDHDVRHLPYPGSVPGGRKTEYTVSDYVNQEIDGLTDEVLYESGVSYGLPYEITGTKEYRVIENDLLKAFRNYEPGHSTQQILARFPKLERLRQDPVDLNYIKGRDYAMGSEKLSKQKIHRMIDKAWRSAGQKIARPFTEEAQKALARINEITKDEISEKFSERKIPLNVETYFRIFYAQVYGKQDYRGIVGFLEWARDNSREEKSKDFCRVVLSDQAFVELYFTARLMDPHSMEQVKILRQPFMGYYINYLFESSGQQRMNEIYGSQQLGDYVERIVPRLVRNSLKLIDFYRKEKNYDKALHMVDNLITFQVSEKRSEADIDSVFESIFEGDTEGALALRSKIMAEKEIKKNIAAAKIAGIEIPTPRDSRYTLFMTSEFFANGELQEHRKLYGERFNLEAIRARSNEHKEVIDEIIEAAEAENIENRTIALVSDEIPEEQLERLKGKGIRFIRTSVKELLDAQADALTGEERKKKEEERKNFQEDTYVMMLLARYISKDTPQDSPIYKLLNFYIASHFQLDKTSVAEYIAAIVDNEVSTLVKGLLSYRPAAKYQVPDYKEIAAALISA